MISEEQQHADMEALLGHLRMFKWLLGGMATFIFIFSCAAIPWAMTVQTDIAVMRSQFESFKAPPEWFEAKVNENTAAIKALNQELIILKHNAVSRNNSG